jgi:hypothetical protein
MRKHPADHCGLQCSYRWGHIRYRICGDSEKKRRLGSSRLPRRPRRPRHPSAFGSVAPGTEGAPDRPPPHNGRPLNQLSHHRQLPLRNNRSDENLTVNWRAHCRELIRTSQPAPCRTAGCDSTALLGTSNLVAGRVLAVAVIAVATSITVASCARTVAGTCAYPATTWRATRRTGRRRWPDRLCSARLDVPISV